MKVMWICKDLALCVGRLRGHGVTGRYIVVLGHGCRMIGGRGNLVLGLPRRQWRHTASQGGESILYRAL